MMGQNYWIYPGPRQLIQAWPYFSPFYLKPPLCFHNVYSFCSFPLCNIYIDLGYKQISYAGVSSSDWFTKSHLHMKLNHKHEYHGNASAQKTHLDLVYRMHLLKRKCHHFDEICITECCQNDNLQCSQWWKCDQNGNSSVLVFLK